MKSDAHHSERFIRDIHANISETLAVRLHHPFSVLPPFYWVCWLWLIAQSDLLTHWRRLDRQNKNIHTQRNPVTTKPIMHGATIDAFMYTQLCEMTVNIVHEPNGLNIVKWLCFNEDNFDDKIKTKFLCTETVTNRITYRYRPFQQQQLTPTHSIFISNDKTKVK